MTVCQTVWVAIVAMYIVHKDYVDYGYSKYSASHVIKLLSHMILKLCICCMYYMYQIVKAQDIATDV